MAGVLPGVEMRRRHHRPHHHVVKFSVRRWFPGNSESAAAAAVAPINEAALQARQRLDQRLHCLASSSCRIDPGVGVGRVGRCHTGSAMAKLLRPWVSRGKVRRSLEWQVCAVCLEGLLHRSAEEVIELSCSHMYHSKCLRPWLVSHPHCPCCRSPVTT